MFVPAVIVGIPVIIFNVIKNHQPIWLSVAAALMTVVFAGIPIEMLRTLSRMRLGDQSVKKSASQICIILIPISLFVSLYFVRETGSQVWILFAVFFSVILFFCISRVSRYYNDYCVAISQAEDASRPWITLAETGQLADAVIAFTDARDRTTFPKIIQSIFSDQTGEYLLKQTDGLAVIWSGLDDATATTLASLIEQDKVLIEPCDPEIYTMDGNVIHDVNWLPCVLRSGPGGKMKVSVEHVVNGS